MPARRRELADLDRLGTEWIERRIQPTLTPGDNGKFVAVDVETGEFEIDADDYTAVMRLRGRVPDAEIWLARAGYPTAYLLRFRA